MSSKIVEALRSEFPELSENSNEEITLALGEAFPNLAENDQEFARDLELYNRGAVGGFAEDFGKSFVASIYDTSTAAYGVLETIAKPFSEEWTKYFRELSDQAAEMGQDLRETGKLASGLSDASFDRGVDQESFASKLGTGAGSLLPIVATGGGASMLGASGAVASRAALTLSGLQSYGSTYQSARKAYEDQGFSEEEAAYKAMAPAALQGLLDLGLTYAGGKIAGKMGAADLEKIGIAIRSGEAKAAVDSLVKGSGVKKLVSGALIEGGVEEAPSSFIGQYLIARSSYNPDVTFDQAMAEAWDSFLIGTTLGGAQGLSNLKRRRKRKSADKEAERNTLRDSSPRVAAKLDEIDAQRSDDAASDVLPDDSASDVLPDDTQEAPLEQPDRDFIEANKDVPMGGRRPIEELPELPVFMQPKLSRQERERQLDERFKELKRLDEAAAKQQAAKEAQQEAVAAEQQARLETVETDPQAVDEVEVSTIQRMMEGQANIDQANQPLTTVQISEAAESELQDERLNDTQRRAVERLQDRKAQLIAESVSANPLRLDEILSEIDNIDSNIAQLLPGVPDSVQPVSPDQLKQFQESFNQQATPEVEVEVEPESQQEAEPAAPAFDPIRVSGDTVEVDGEVDSKLRGSLRKALNQVKRQFGTLGGVKKITVVELDDGAGVASAARVGDTETIYVDPRRLSESVSNKKFSLEKAVEEEVIHNIDAQALKSEYASLLAKGDVTPETTPAQFIQQRYQSIADGMTADEKARTRKIYGSEFVDDVHMAQEFSRQLIQKRHTDSVTEDAKRNPILRQIFEAIERFLSKAKNLSGAAKVHLDQVEKFLLDSYSAEVADAAIVEEQRSDAVERKRQLAKNKFAEEDEENRKALLFMDRAQSAIRIVTGKDLQDQQGKDLYDDMYDAYSKLDREGNVDSDDGVPKLAFFKDIAEKRIANIIQKNKAQKRRVEMMSLDAPVSEDSSDPMQVADRKAANPSDSTDFGKRMYSFFRNRGGEKLGLTPLEIEAWVGRLEGKTYEEISEERVEAGGDPVNKASLSRAFNNGLSKLAAAATSQDGQESIDVDSEIRGMIAAIQAESENIYSHASRVKLSYLDKIFSKIPNPREVIVSLTKKGKSLGKKGKGLIVNPLKNVTDPITGESYLDIFGPMIEKDAYIQRVTNTMKYRRRDLERAVKKEYSESGGYTESLRLLIDEHMHGDTTAPDLAEETAAAVKAMRDQIDALSAYMIKKGYVDGELAVSFQDNFGVYIARSYRIFDDPDYSVESVPPAVFQAAVNYVAGQLANGTQLSNAEIKEAQRTGGQVRANGPTPDALQRKEAEKLVRDNFEQLKRAGQTDFNSISKLGTTDLSLFKRKNNDLAPEIRALLGEYTDPDVNYARTITRMAQFVANKRFQDQLVQDGMGKIFFEFGDNQRIRFAHVQIPESEQYGALGGLYTTPEVKDLIDNYNKASLGIMTQGEWYHILSKLSVTTKSVKTIGSLMTHARNLIGQPFFLALNGHLDVLEGGERMFRNVATIWADAHGTDKAAQAYFNKLTRLGLVGEDLTTGELKRTLGKFSEELAIQGNPQNALDSVFASKIGSLAGKTKDSIIRAYRASDELGKIAAFEMEVEKLSKLPTYAAMSRAEIEKLAAKRVRMTMPTYSEIPPAMQHLATQPIIGPFMSFAYESGRTQINNLKIIREELENGNKAYALSRAGGHLLATAGYTVGIKALSALLGGVGDDEQEAMRELLPDYEKNAVIYFSKGEDGKINYTNWSFNNPYSGFTDGISTMLGLNGMQGDGSMTDHVIRSLTTTFSPFVSETIIASSLLDLARNKDRYGREVVNPEADAMTQFVDGLMHVGKAFAPGTLERFARRTLPAYRGETLRSGESPELKDEVKAELFGFRTRTIDIADKLQRLGYSNKSRLSSANRIFNEVAGSRGTVSNQDMLSAYEDANESRYRVFQSIEKQIEAARLAGLEEYEIRNALKGSNMSLVDINNLMQGVYRPMEVSSHIKRSARNAGHPVPIGQISLIKRKYLRRELSSEDDN